MEQVEKQIEAARKDLLDLTLRNKLLNFRPTKSRTVAITSPSASEIGQVLVSREGTFSFLCATNGDEPDVSDSAANGYEEIVSTRSGGSNTVSRKKSRRVFETTLPQHDLTRILLKVYRQSAEVLAEQGYSVLFLALGLLHWSEADQSEEFHKAPLILVPVELDRQKVGDSFTLRWTGEEVLINVSLQSKLIEQSVELPELDVNEEVDFVGQYFESVKRAVSNKPGWKVIPDSYLDFFSFTKFIMYKDLDPSSWPDGTSPADHPLLKALFSDTMPPPSNDRFLEDHIDEKLKMHDMYHVMDADPSQIAVIEDVKAGCNLVVEGPPGTGKSQTITNLIAELLALGKSVLFISEKMAALEVVKRRLDEAKLGDFCLELHSRKASKKELLKELERVTNSCKDLSEPPAEAYLEVDHLREELNEYARALNEPFGKIAKKPFELFEMREEAYRILASQQITPPSLDIPEPDKVTMEEWRQAVLAVENLSYTLAHVGQVKHNPWYPTEPGLLLPRDIHNVATLIQDCTKWLRELEKAGSNCEQSFGIRAPRNLNDVPQFYRACKLVASLDHASPDILTEKNYSVFKAFSQKTISILKAYQLERDRILVKFKEEALDSPIDEILAECKDSSSSVFRIFFRDYRRLRRQVASFYVNKVPFWPKRVMQELRELQSCANKRKEIRELTSTAKECFGCRWQAEETDTPGLETFARGMETFRKLMEEGYLTNKATEVISGTPDLNGIEQVTTRVRKAAGEFTEKMDQLLQILNIDCPRLFGADHGEVGFSLIIARLMQWHDNLSALHGWSNFCSARRKCEQTVAKPITALLETEDLHAGDIVPIFKINFVESLINAAFTQRPCLAKFQGSLHEKKIDRFRALDSKLIELNRLRLEAKLHHAIPKLQPDCSAGSQAGILLAEINKKRRHKPIRKLMSMAGGLIQRIKPCFMMSPLSVAQYLDPRTVRFDVVIFDEGSQVKPADALGSILRGNQLVVAGDSKQLPPTSFFDHVVSDLDESEEESATLTSDMESILRLCRVRFPVKWLRWHYRSRHESLIAVSNQEFYEDKLRIYPSPVDNDGFLGLQFRHIPHSVYDRGRSSVNRIEAQEVAKAALEHFKRHPEKSLGIGTFNIRQQQEILDEIETLCREHSDLESFFRKKRI